jgi:hypothetical protein
VAVQRFFRFAVIVGRVSGSPKLEPSPRSATCEDQGTESEAARVLTLLDPVVDNRILEFDSSTVRAYESGCDRYQESQQQAYHCLTASCQTDCEPLSPILYTITTDPIARTTIATGRSHPVNELIAQFSVPADQF